MTAGIWGYAGGGERDMRTMRRPLAVQSTRSGTAVVAHAARGPVR